MTEEEKQVEISLCEKYLKYLKKPHFSWDILLRPIAWCEIPKYTEE